MDLVLAMFFDPPIASDLLTTSSSLNNAKPSRNTQSNDEMVFLNTDGPFVCMSFDQDSPNMTPLPTTAHLPTNSPALPLNILTPTVGGYSKWRIPFFDSSSTTESTASQPQERIVESKTPDREHENETAAITIMPSKKFSRASSVH